ncbi:hypothetical protein RGQ30_16370 [Limnobacter thiooxidans]|uniref:Uncharacterized protein n=1 Tax=Limnobacter thiooxidans TaxID=131080 RepID=A0AA86JFP9_9BURK|nr:hypothetical protein RGQ30_16370 [Limnobacter thiooxidans]
MFSGLMTRFTLLGLRGVDKTLCATAGALSKIEFHKRTAAMENLLFSDLNTEEERRSCDVTSSKVDGEWLARKGLPPV